MFSFFEKKDHQLEKDVLSELQWDSSVSADKIQVTAKDGIVTLRGAVPHYSEKSFAEQAVQRVSGVRAVADELEVKIQDPYGKSDQDIARAALDALEWSYSAPKGTQVVVDKGWVTLRGKAEWEFERTAARDCVKSLMGVVGVTNEIAIQTKVQVADIKTRIEDALKRSAESDSSRIHVAVQGNRVVLTGSVHSFSEMSDAGTAAWNAPGVVMVENSLLIA
jgi:osmotically-inducible protein OsmY